MLIEFKVKNFLSIKDEQILSMIASTGKELIDKHTVEVEKYRTRVVRCAAIFGPNASGKTNILKALSFIKDFVLTSDTKRPEEETGVVPFKFTSQTTVSKFEITFLIEDIKYVYGFELDNKTIYNEWLFYYPKNYKRRLFERNNQNSYYFGADFKGPNKKIAEMTKNNSLFLSVASTFNHAFATKIYEWFRNKLGPLKTFSECLVAPFFDEEIYKFLEENRENIVSFLRKADPGIRDIKLKKIDKVDKFLQLELLSEKAKEQLLKAFKNIKEIFLVHAYYEDGLPIEGELKLQDESHGTQVALFAFPSFLKAIKDNAILVIDELEASMHPLLIRFLLDMFFNNSTHAQLIFTSHYIDLLDLSLFRRDEIWFTEKDESGSTNLFSLSDITPKPRLDDDIKRRYLYGKYGAIPEID